MELDIDKQVKKNLLREHLAEIGKKGGLARQAALSPRQRKALGKLGGRPKGSKNKVKSCQ